MSSINLSYSKEFQILLTSSKMTYSGLITCSARPCFSELLGIVAKTLYLVWISYRRIYIITGWLPGYDRPNSSHVAGLDDND